MRKPLFYNSRPPNSASQINQQIILLQPPFSYIIFINCMLIFQKMVDWGTASKPSGRQNGTNNRPSGAKMAKPKPYSRHIVLFRKKKTQIHVETHSGLDFRFFYIFRLLNLFDLSGKYMVFHLFSLAPNTSRNTKRIGPPKSNGRQKGSQNIPRRSIRWRFSIFWLLLF